MDIFVLKRQKRDPNFGEHGEWELVGWTDDAHVAYAWRLSGRRDEFRDFEEVSKATPGGFWNVRE